MEVRYKRFFSTTIGYFVGNVFTKLISFILLPLYTKLIDPTIYGIYGVNMTIVQLVVPVVYMAIWNSIFRYASEKDSDEGRYRVISIGLPVMWISSVVCVIVLLCINVVWNLYNPILVCTYAVANAFQYFYGYVARSMRNNKIFIISGCINSTINLLLNWLGIVYFHHGIEVLYYSYIIGTIMQVVIIELKYRVLGHFRFDYVQKSSLCRLMKFGGPLALNSIMQWLLTGLTQVVIARALGTYYNGLFSVAIKFATIISLIVSVFEYAWLELAYEIARNDKSALYYKRTINMLFTVLMFGSATLMLMIKIIFPYLIAEAYGECLLIIPHVVVFACTSALASFSASIYMSYKDVNTLMVSSLIAGGTNFLLLLVLVPRLSFQGAMVSLVIASVLMMVIRCGLLWKKYSINIEMMAMKNIGVILVSSCVFYKSDMLSIDIFTIIVCVIVFFYMAREFYLKYLSGN